MRPLALLGWLSFAGCVSSVPAAGVTEKRGVYFDDTSCLDNQVVTYEATTKELQCPPVTVDDSGNFVLPSYTHTIEIDPGSAVVGSTPPTFTVAGTAGCLAFDNDNEAVYLHKEIPDNWDGASDWTLVIDWHPESGAAMADTETVKWDLDYRIISEGEAVDNGTVAASTATYTQSGAGTDKELIITSLTIDWDEANQTLVKGDLFFAAVTRDMTADTYASDAVVCDLALRFTATDFPKE